MNARSSFHTETAPGGLGFFPGGVLSPIRRLSFALSLTGVLLWPVRAAGAPVRVEFRFQHETAPIVNLAGSFNGWCNASGGWIDTDIDPMDGPDGDGWWTLEKLLSPGDHEYKFVVDGHIWYTDPLNPRVNHSNYDNSMLEVTDPLVYYLLPKDGSEVATSWPEVSAYLGKSDGASFDLSTLRILVDGDVVAEGPSAFDAGTRRVSFGSPDSLADGMHGAKVRVALVGGATDSDTTAFEVEADTSPPEIAHSPPAGAVAHAPLFVECTITDETGVESASLFYRNSGDPAFVEAPMFEGLDEGWTGAVPAGFTRAGVDLEYSIEARDKIHTARAPQSGVYAVPVSADDQPPVISDAFASPATLDPGGQDDETRLSFRLSEPCSITVEMETAAGDPVDRLLAGQSAGEGYHQVVWDATDSLGSAVPDGEYRITVSAVDGAGLPAESVEVPVGVDRSSDPGPIHVVLLFHANQNLNYYGDFANDVCFWGLIDVLRRHPQSKFMIHFSGTLLHDLGWFNFRHEPSTLDMLRAGYEDGQFEIVGSTYAQNVPYGTHMWDNERQVEVHRDVIAALVGASPVSFWNAERCWKQGLTPLMADHGYGNTWVETHILWDSGTSAPEHAVRRTRLGEDEVVVFNDDGDMIGLLDWAIDSGNSSDLVSYLDWLRSQDAYRDWVVCYAQDAEAAGLWDYEGGSDPRDDWSHLDQVLTDLESTGWIELTTFSEYLEDHAPTEDLTPIVDGQANWMVGPSQSAGYADWFDYNERSPLLAAYRDFFTGLRTRIQGVEALAAPGTPAANLVRHAIWNLAAHQFEFACIGCGGVGCQDWQKAETLEGALLAAEASLSPPRGTTITETDANGDSLPDWVIQTPTDFYIVSETGGRLLRWFDLVRGEEVLGNELFMWGFYYWGWRHWYSGSGYNDDEHYMEDAVWDAPHSIPPAQPYHRTYRIRGHAFNDRLSIDGGADTVILDAPYAAQASGDTLAMTYSGAGVHVSKVWIAQDTALSVLYELTNTTGSAHQYNLTVENELNPSLLEVMNGGRGTLVYWDGSDTSTALTSSSIGVVNVRTERAVEFEFSEPAADLAGGESVHGLMYTPTFGFTLGPAETQTLRVTVGATTTSIPSGEQTTDPLPPFALHQNYPNPFNPVTHVVFDLPTVGVVDVVVFDVRGRRVRTLAQGPRGPGRHTVVWDGTDDAGRAVATGVYLCRLRSGSRVQAKKMLLLR